MAKRRPAGDGMVPTPILRVGSCIPDAPQKISKLSKKPLVTPHSPERSYRRLSLVVVDILHNILNPTIENLAEDFNCVRADALVAL